MFVSVEYIIGIFWGLLTDVSSVVKDWGTIYRPKTEEIHFGRNILKIKPTWLNVTYFLFYTALIKDLITFL